MIVLFMLIGIGMMGLGVYSFFHSKRMTKNSPVHATVVDCQESVMRIMGQDLPCYEVNLEVPGPYGTIYRSMKVKSYYNPGDSIMVCYNADSDKLDLPQNVDQSNGKGPLVLIVFGAIWTAILGAVMYTKLVPEASESIGLVIGLLIGIIFTVVGVYLGIIAPIKRKRDLPQCNITEGKIVDYKTKRSRRDGRTRIIYTPIYEYYYNGEWKRHEASVSSNSSKYKQIGREVTIVVNPATGKVYCKEDENTSVWMGWIFLIFGIVICVILVS